MAAPLDPDADPAWTRRPLLGVVVVAGGAAGTLVRALLERASTADFPWTTLAINVAGSFLLGSLLTFLARGGPDTGSRHVLRLGLGTGVLGGFTTYSTFAVEADRLTAAGDVTAAVLYPLVSIGLGFLAAGAGAAVARMGSR